MVRSNSAFTLIEVMVASVVFVLTIGVLLLVFIGCLSLNATSRNLTTSINAAGAKLEEICQHDLDIITSSYIPGGDPGDSFGISDWTRPHSGIISIIDDGSDEPDHLTNDNLIQVTISVCWQEKGGRIIGEDKNLDGNFDLASEDKNGNGRLDSPTQLITLISRH